MSLGFALVSVEILANLLSVVCSKRHWQTKTLST